MRLSNNIIAYSTLDLIKPIYFIVQYNLYMHNAAAVIETVQCNIFRLVSSFRTKTTGDAAVSAPNTGNLANLRGSLST